MRKQTMKSRHSYVEQANYFVSKNLCRQGCLFCNRQVTRTSARYHYTSVASRLRHTSNDAYLGKLMIIKRN